MNITTVEYRRLRSFGSFENESVGATAVVGPDESADAVLADLRQWVTHELNAVEDREERRRQVADVGYELEAKKRELAEYTERAERAKKFLELHGLSTELWSLPF